MARAWRALKVSAGPISFGKTSECREIAVCDLAVPGRCARTEFDQRYPVARSDVDLFTLSA